MFIDSTENINYISDKNVCEIKEVNIKSGYYIIVFFFLNVN